MVVGENRGVGSIAILCAVQLSRKNTGKGTKKRGRGVQGWGDMKKIVNIKVS